jgi:hypothetical protein
VGNLVEAFVSSGQLQVVGGYGEGDLRLCVAGDALVTRTAADQLTVLAGLHTGRVLVRVTEVDDEPGLDAAWDAESEDTLWSPEGRVAVQGLMSGPPEGLDDVVTGGPGLYRVRVRARYRRREGPGYDELPPEEFEVLLRRVDVDAGLTTYRGDALPPLADPDPAAAATWAARRFVTEADPPGERRSLLRGMPPRPEGPRAGVRRRHPMPADVAAAALAGPATWLGAAGPDGHGDEELVLPMGPLAIRLRLRGAAEPARVVYGWDWSAVPGSTAEPPDDVESTVELRLEETDGESYLAVVHSGVRAADAVQLGLLWEHLLERAASAADGEAAWVAPLGAAARQAREAAEARRLRSEEHLRTEWGGRLPSERLQRLPANVFGLRQLDPTLPFALEAVGDDRQLAVARWAARRGLEAARLDTVGWIADLLAAAERGESPALDLAAAFERMFADPSVPQTVVNLPGGPPNALQQAIVLPAVFSACGTDAGGGANPLAAAVNAVYAAALGHGDAYREFLATLRDAFPDLRD